MELSASFLGALTLLQWACSRAADSPVFPLTDVFPCVSRFPVNLTLVKAKWSPDGLQNPGPVDGGCVPLRVMERKDWGALATHCYTLYWKCLSSFLKWAEPPGEQNRPGGLSDEETGRARVTAIGSADVAEVARCCLDNMDVAAFSVGVVIESVCTVLPKVCGGVGATSKRIVFKHFQVASGGV